MTYRVMETTNTDGNAEGAADDRRFKALCCFQSFALVQFCLGVMLFICGAIATISVADDDSRNDFLPIGAFIGGGCIILSALVLQGALCHVRSKMLNNPGEAIDASCWIYTMCALCIVLLIVCSMGFIFSLIISDVPCRKFGPSRMSPVSPHEVVKCKADQERNMPLSIAIMCGLGIAVLSTVSMMCPGCIYGKLFGCNMNVNRNVLRYQAAVVVNDSGNAQLYVNRRVPITTNINTHLSNEATTIEIQRQNELLQEQIRLQNIQLEQQRLLIQQNEQHPYQYRQSDIDSVDQICPPPSYKDVCS